MFLGERDNECEEPERVHINCSACTQLPYFIPIISVPNRSRLPNLLPQFARDTPMSANQPNNATNTLHIPMVSSQPTLHLAPQAYDEAALQSSACDTGPRAYIANVRGGHSRCRLAFPGRRSSSKDEPGTPTPERKLERHDGKGKPSRDTRSYVARQAAYRPCKT